MLRMDGERKREETSDDGENRMNHVSSFVFALCRSRHDFSSSPCVERGNPCLHTSSWKKVKNSDSVVAYLSDPADTLNRSERLLLTTELTCDVCLFVLSSSLVEF